MLAIVVLIGLLSLAQASLKTPRTAIPASPSLSLSSTATASTVISPATTKPACDMSPSQFNGSSPSLPQRTRTAPVETRSAVRLPGTAVSIMPIGTGSNSPQITPSPEFDPPGGNFHEIGAKFVQTTYWSCVTFPLETHCGWHEPILDAGAGRARCEGGGQAALRAGIVAGVVAGGLMFGI
ncbi:hypothetical protein F4820DRAFT_17765 [Hypoxylon rubiginosum]|uniref:Uncharacterized protein n=1 Tax=Hypoxylon rubiginosum TaxID=110542 RepID=A0ACB9YUJ0_9PEZI|nr:hypothetical protein F4820DRAFT_17765 [Hypoxylon rubiginosum]